MLRTGMLEATLRRNTMLLKEYLERKNMTYQKFADSVGCCRDYISMMVRGLNKPGHRLARDISRATGGMVREDEIQTPIAKKDVKKNIENIDPAS